MREIKFRAWDKSNREMVFDGFDISPDGNIWINNFSVADQFILMQSTGLRDKNGSEIYDSDLVKIFCHPECEAAKCSISWFNDRWWVLTDRNQKGIMEECKLPLGELVQSIDQKGEYSRVEIIGNIYENHELLNL